MTVYAGSYLPLGIPLYVREGEEKERSRKRKKEIRDQTLFPGIERKVKD